MPTKNAQRVLVLIPAFLVAMTALAGAGEVTFDGAILAASKVPGVEAARSELESRQRLDRSLKGNRGPLVVQVAPGRRLSPEADVGTEISLSVAQGWSLGDPAGHSKSAARAERDVLAARLRARALAARIDVARRWMELHRLQRALALARDETRVMAEIDVANQQARAAGLVTQVAEAEARTAHAEAERMELALEGERVRAALDLSVALGAEPDADLKTAGALPEFTLPAPERIRALTKQVDRLPEVALLRLQSVAASARAAESTASRGSQLSFGAQAQRESNGSTLLFGTLGFTVSAPRTGRREWAMSNAEARRRLIEADDVAVALRAELADAVHELEHSEELWQLITSSLGPASETLLQQRTRQLELGEGTVIEVLRARARVMAAKRYEADAATERRWAQVHLWLLLAEIATAENEGESR